MINWLRATKAQTTWLAPPSMLFKYPAFIELVHALPGGIWCVMVPLQLTPGGRAFMGKQHKTTGRVMLCAASVLMVGSSPACRSLQKAVSSAGQIQGSEKVLTIFPYIPLWSLCNYATITPPPPPPPKKKKHPIPIFQAPILHQEHLPLILSRLPADRCQQVKCRAGSVWKWWDVGGVS